MASPSKTPQALDIKQRDYRFGREGAPHPRWWLNGDPIATGFYNALSATFPLGERFFMESVKPFRELAPEPLKSQIAAFLFQESVHSREHVVFNEMAAAAGYDLSSLDERTRSHIAIAKTRPAVAQLAATCALEHFTAILAKAVLSDPRHFEGAPDEAQRMWTWHAMEEIEHKAVAYDTFLTATRNWRPLRRYIMRCMVMFFSTGIFFKAIFGNMRDLFEQDGLNKASTWRAVARYLLVSPGIVRTVAGSYFSYYKPGFHPWEEDDRPLLAATRVSVDAPLAA